VELFCKVGTQWRTAGASGQLVGLDYGAVYPLMDRMGLSAQRWDELFQDLQTLESEALETRNEARDSET
jgi:hypothetical protein